MGVITSPGVQAVPVIPRRSEAGPYQLRDVPRQHLPYYVSTAGPLTGNLTFDREGIAVRVTAGKSYDHPVLQAQYMMQRLASYQVNHDPRYLASVEAHAARIQSYAQIWDGAAYLPYPFPFNLHGNPSWVLAPPWFSGMAQGQALGAFSRLARETGKAEYRIFADKLFASFSKINSANAPWAPVTLSSGDLWFEEYPGPPGQADRAMNGHIFAIFGLYDYWQLIRSSTAATYATKGMEAVAGVIDTIRNPGWISNYCITHRVTSTSYHRVHVGQLYQLFTFTGDASFARIADEFLEDYPTAQAGGRAYIGAGDHAGLSLTGSGGRMSSVRLTAAKAEAASCDSRAKLAGRDGVFLRITSGTLRGYWVKELPKRSFIRLYVEAYKFSQPRLLRFTQGEYTGHKFNTNGASMAQKTTTLNSNSAAHVGLRAICNGAMYYKMLDGIWTDWWIPDNDRVTLL